MTSDSTNLTADDSLDKLRTTLSLLLSNFVVLVGEGMTFEGDSGSWKQTYYVHVLQHVTEHVGGQKELEEGRLKLCVQNIIDNSAVFPAPFQPVRLGQELHEQH